MFCSGVSPCAVLGLMLMSSKSPAREDTGVGSSEGLGVLPADNQYTAQRSPRLLPTWMASVADRMNGSYWRLWRLVGTRSWRFRLYRQMRRLFRPCGIEHLRYLVRARRFAKLETAQRLPRADARLLTELRSKNLVFAVTAGR